MWRGGDAVDPTALMRSSWSHILPEWAVRGGDVFENGQSETT